MVAQSTLATTRRYLDYLRDNGIPIRFGVIFGSEATGRTHEYSDIDLLVVSPTFDGELDRKDTDALWIRASEIDSRIEPIPCGEKQWLEDNSSAIIEIARREGEIVWPGES